MDMWMSFYLTSRFSICKHLVQQKGPVTPEFFNHLKRNNRPSFLTEIDVDHNLQIEYINNIEHIAQDTDSEIENCNAFYNELIVSTTKALDFLKEQKSAGNIRWVKSVKKNFIPIMEMVKKLKNINEKE